jgi:hypothetical protein
MAKKKKHAKANGGEVLADAKETAAIEKAWKSTGRPKPRKPPRKYKYVEELALLLSGNAVLESAPNRAQRVLW